jgi:hypothetical protein
MGERIMIDLDGLTGPYLHHYAEQWGKSLDEAVVVWLQVQAKSWEFKQKVAAEFEAYAGTDAEDLRAVEIEEAQRLAEDWVAQWLSEAGKVNTEALTYAYRALGEELARRSDD